VHLGDAGVILNELLDNNLHAVVPGESRRKSETGVDALNGGAVSLVSHSTGKVVRLIIDGHTRGRSRLRRRSIRLLVLHHFSIT